jgi:uncharacterized RDD family membrane protein YckC
MAMHNKYFTFWPRFWAGLLDLFVLFPVTLLDYWFWRQPASTELRTTWLVFVAVSAPLYRILLHGLTGQTVGKRALDIRVLDVSGSPLSLRQAILRDLPWLAYTAWVLALSLPRVLDGLGPSQVLLAELHWPVRIMVTFILVELVTTLANAKRRAVHDFLAGSVVTRLRKPGLAPVRADRVFGGETC